MHQNSPFLDPKSKNFLSKAVLFFTEDVVLLKVCHQVRVYDMFLCLPYHLLPPYYQPL